MPLSGKAFRKLLKSRVVLCFIEALNISAITDPWLSISLVLQIKRKKKNSKKCDSQSPILRDKVQKILGEN